MSTVGAFQHAELTSMEHSCGLRCCMTQSNQVVMWTWFRMLPQQPAWKWVLYVHAQLTTHKRRRMSVS